MAEKNKLQDKGWASMATTLDREMPQKKKRRAVIWFFLLGILILAGLLFSIPSTSDDREYHADQYADDSRSSTQDDGNKKSELISHDFNDNSKKKNTDEYSTNKVAETAPIDNYTSQNQPTDKILYEQGISTPTNSILQNEASNNKSNTYTPIKVEATNTSKKIVAILHENTNHTSSTKADINIDDKSIRNKVNSQNSNSNTLHSKSVSTSDNAKVDDNVKNKSIAEVTGQEVEDNNISESEIKIINDNEMSVESDDGIEKTEIVEQNIPNPVTIIPERRHSSWFPFVSLEGAYAKDNMNGYALGGGIGYGNDIASIYTEAAFSNFSIQSMFDEGDLVLSDAGTNFPSEPSTVLDYSSLLTNARSIDLKLGVRKSLFSFIEIDLGLKYRRYLSVSNVEFNFAQNATLEQDEKILSNSLYDNATLNNHDIAPEIYFNYMPSASWRLGVGYSHGMKNLIKSEDVNAFSNIIATEGDAFYNRYFTAKVSYSF